MEETHLNVISTSWNLFNSSRQQLQFSIFRDWGFRNCIAQGELGNKNREICVVDTFISHLSANDKVQQTVLCHFFAINVSKVLKVETKTIVVNIVIELFCEKATDY